MKRFRGFALLALSAIASSAAVSGCGGLRQPAVVLEPDAIVHLLRPTRIGSAGVERKADPSVVDVVENVELPAGYVCVPPDALE